MDWSVHSQLVGPVVLRLVRHQDMHPQAGLLAELQRPRHGRQTAQAASLCAESAIKLVVTQQLSKWSDCGPAVLLRWPAARLCRCTCPTRLCSLHNTQARTLSRLMPHLKHADIHMQLGGWRTV